MIFQIAKAELRNLFYSPVAWFLTIAFLVQCAYFYTYPIHTMALFQDLAIENKPDFKDWGKYPITALFFLSQNGIFTMAMQNLYLYVPLLTMGLIGREVQTGTIKLLYSSPINLRQIVLGKYVAIVAYNALLVLVLGIFMALGVWHIKDADYGLLLSAALGFFLLTCAYTAIGLFMSSLTTYQIIAAIGSFLIIFTLGRIGTLWQQYDFIRDLTFFLHLPGRADNMLKGLIRTKDVIYFVLIVCMFLSITLIKLRSGRESKSWWIKTMRYCAVITSALMIGYVCSLPRFTGYWDTTAGNQNTIHERTQKIIKELGNEPMEVTLYINLLGEGSLYGLPSARNKYLSELWEQYQRFKTNIRFNYVYYYYYDKSMDVGARAAMFPGKNMQEMAREMAKGMNVKVSQFGPPETVRDFIALKPENYQLVMQLQYKDRKELLRIYDKDPWPKEQNVAAAIKRLLMPVTPKVYFVSGHYERSIEKKGDREYRYNTTDKLKRDAMINLGIDFDSLNLDTQDIPADITALVLADPKTSLSETCKNKIQQYIGKGGNMMIIGEPAKQDILNPILRPLGVELMSGTLVEPTYDEMPQMVKPYFTEASVGLSEEPHLVLLKEQFKTKRTNDTLKRVMPGVVAVSYADTGAFAKKVLLRTDATRSWNKAGAFVTDSAEIVFNGEEGDIKGSFPTMIQLTRSINNKEQRILVSGDADYTNNARILSGEFLGRSTYSYLSDGTFPVYIPRPAPKDNLLTLTAKDASAARIFFVWVLPGICILLGSALIMRRKRN